MLQSILLAGVVTLLIHSGCQNHPQHASSSRLPEPAVLRRLQYQKKSSDAYYERHPGAVQQFAKMEGSAELIPYSDSLEEGLEATYALFKDSSGRTVSITESPYSESGDWNISVTHYFERDEHTYAIERQTNFFNSGCTGSVAYETRVVYYNNAFQVVGNEYRLVDKDNKPLSRDSCSFLYEYDYKPMPNLRVYLRETGLKTAGRN